MNPIDQLKAVLCDPSGKCCITGSDEDRAIVDRALAAIAEAESAAPHEWQGLTDAEAQWLYDNCRTPANLIDMVEAKLKEKNT